jgi:hypothetical protein
VGTRCSQAGRIGFPLMLDEIIQLLRSLAAVWLMLLLIGIVAGALWPRGGDGDERPGRMPLDDNGKDL